MRAGRYVTTVSLIAALGGFLMGFDASVISGITGFIEPQFRLSRFQLGWVVSSLTLAATLAMLVAGPLSDRIGRRRVLQLAAIMYASSAILSVIAPNYYVLVLARMVGGLGVGASLIVAPMYIAEFAPAPVRGRMVSFNQLNIVIGISAAFFSNYLFLQAGAAGWFATVLDEDQVWRLMLGIEIIPAIIYLTALGFIPESPRWLIMHGRDAEAGAVLERATGPGQAKRDVDAVHRQVRLDAAREPVAFRELFRPAMKLVLFIGVSIGALQQITGINAVFYYAPMIFEQSGIGTNASFMQAALVGLVNLVFTLIAMLLIDRVGRRPLLCFGLGGITVCMLTLAWGFNNATYRLDADAVEVLPADVRPSISAALADTTFESDVAFRQAVSTVIGSDAYALHESALVAASINMQPRVILLAILGFVACFALSIGPVMWVLFSELFPNAVRGLAISFSGFVNSTVAFLVVFVFPWELHVLGNAATFLIYGLFAFAGLLLVWRVLPETKGRSLEELERELVHA